MLNSPLPPPAGPEPRDADIEAIVASGPRGAIVVAGIATFLVVAIWFASISSSLRREPSRHERRDSRPS
jgi:hypothetical protein